MSKLGNIQDSARHTVAAISAALGVEVAIIDADSTFIASSKGYIEAKVQEPEEIYKPHKPFIDAVITEKTIVCKSPGYFSYCQGCRLEGQCPETAEVLCAIEMDDKVIGVISMVAFDEEQRYRLLGKIDTLLEFIHEMAQMLVSKIREKEHTEWVRQVNSLIETTLDSINDGIITFDNSGVITHTNKVASQLLKVPNDKLLSYHIDQIVTGKNIVDFIRLGNSIRHQEYIFQGPVPVHCLISIKPIYIEKEISGGVLSLTDIRDIRTVVNEIVGMNGTTSFESFIGESDEIIQIKQEALKMAQSDSTILIQGESGTGKEILARAIHSASSRAKGAFIAINCAAIPEMLLESELFGYEQGAFTGAKKGGKQGKFELADGGTLFLDEIGDMPLHLQVKLLRVLQERTFDRVGGTRTIPLDIRIIAATNQELEEKVRLKEFRLDLYYRLNVIPIVIPPLRERRKDIVVLSKYFLLKYKHDLKKEVVDFTAGALEALGNYSWPGNVRELENAVEYAVNIENSNYICETSLPKRIREQSPQKRTLKDKMRQFEINEITGALDRHGWGSGGKEAAARELAISVPSLYRKLMEAESDSLDFKIERPVVGNDAESPKRGK
ncbi:MAG: sigma-54 interaction domain-containing protein [Negativicutes bacterium]